MLLTAADRETTPSWLRELAARIGISRVADVTHLDYIGMPVFQAVRPASRSYVVTQGKGLDATAAKVSAVVESAELYCAERVSPDVRASLSEMAARARYDVHALPCTAPSGTYGAVMLDWVRAAPIAGGPDDFVPLALFSTDYRISQRPAASPFRRTTNGIGAGPDLAHAVVHGLLEVIERDAVSRGTARRVALEPFDDTLDPLIAAIARAGLSLELLLLEHRSGVPVVRAEVFEPGTSVAFVGSCAAPSGLAALRGAVTEALQSRLTLLTGTRDDLDDAHYDAFRRAAPRRDPSAPAQASIHAIPAVAGDPTSLARRLHEITGFAPLQVDLSRPELGIAVVFVLAPGLEFTARLH